MGKNRKVFENAYVTAHFKHAQCTLKQSLVTKTDDFLSVFVIQCGWSKTHIKDSVDGNLFMRFHVTENGGFRKRISVDRALVWTENIYKRFSNFSCVVWTGPKCCVLLPQQMAKLVIDYMAVHGTRFIRRCVPVKVVKSDDGRLNVHWKKLSSGKEQEDRFDTVLFAVGTFFPSICIDLYF